MLEVSDVDVKRKIEFQNPWWATGEIDGYLRKMTSRAYLELFYKLLKEQSVNRAVVLMGPRRVGKTVMIYHSIQRLIAEGVKPGNIIYFSVETPNYFDFSLEKLLQLALGERLISKAKDIYVFFDEIQYLKKWEVHLKSLVDQYRGIQFIASGSAAAALKLKGMESGAGRFTDFILPPLTFYEYLKFIGQEKLADMKVKDVKIKELNREFINYLNYGGYPEALFSEEIQKDPGRYIRSDIIDKVLLRDLPGLYGIKDIQELNRLFTALAYNTANEVSLNELSQNSGVAKQTIIRYMEYLEAAFLIKRLPRIDEKGRKFKRSVRFKIHLTNPSMRCALFGPVDENDEFMGFLAETAIFSQLIHSPSMDCFYARWKKGEIDIVQMSVTGPFTFYEVKWSDKGYKRSENLKVIKDFIKSAKPKVGIITSRTIFDLSLFKTMAVIVLPTSWFCYRIGRSIMESKRVEEYLPELLKENGDI